MLSYSDPYILPPVAAERWNEKEKSIREVTKTSKSSRRSSISALMPPPTINTPQQQQQQPLKSSSSLSNDNNTTTLPIKSNSFTISMGCNDGNDDDRRGAPPFPSPPSSGNRMILEDNENRGMGYIEENNNRKNGEEEISSTRHYNTIQSSSSISSSVASLHNYYNRDTPESLKAARRSVLEAVKAMDEKFSVSWDAQGSAIRSLPDAVKDIPNAYDEYDNTSGDTLLTDNDDDDDDDDKGDSNNRQINEGDKPASSSSSKWLFRNKTLLRNKSNNDADDDGYKKNKIKKAGRGRDVVASNRGYLIPRMGVLPPGQLRRASSVGMMIPKANSTTTTTMRNTNNTISTCYYNPTATTTTTTNTPDDNDDDGRTSNDGGGHNHQYDGNDSIHDSYNNLKNKKDNYIMTYPSITGLHIRGRIKYLFTRRCIRSVNSQHHHHGGGGGCIRYDDDDRNRDDYIDDDDDELIALDHSSCCDATAAVVTGICGGVDTTTTTTNITPHCIPLVTSIPNDPHTHCILLLGEMYLPSNAAAAFTGGSGYNTNGYIATQIAVDALNGDIAVGTSNGMILVWIREYDTSHSRSPNLQLRGHIDSITSLHYSCKYDNDHHYNHQTSSSSSSLYHPPIINTLVSSSLDGSTVLWTPRLSSSSSSSSSLCDKPLAVIRHFKPITGPFGIEGTGINIPTYASTVLPTSDNGLRTPLLFIACADGAVEIYELTMGDIQSTVTNNNHNDNDDDYEDDDDDYDDVVVVDPNKRSSGNPPKKIHTVRIEGMATAVALSPDGLRLAVGSSVGTVTMFLLKTLRLDGVIDCRNRYGKLKDGRKIIGMQWQKDSQRLLVTTSDCRIRVIHLRDLSRRTKMKETSIYANDNLMLQARYSCYESRVLAASERGYICIWDLDYNDESTNDKPEVVCDILLRLRGQWSSSQYSFANNTTSTITTTTKLSNDELSLMRRRHHHNGGGGDGNSKDDGDDYDYDYDDYESRVFPSSHVGISGPNLSLSSSIDVHDDEPSRGIEYNKKNTNDNKKKKTTTGNSSNSSIPTPGNPTNTTTYPPLTASFIMPIGYSMNGHPLFDSVVSQLGLTLSKDSGPSLIVVASSQGVIRVCVELNDNEDDDIQASRMVPPLPSMLSSSTLPPPLGVGARGYSTNMSTSLAQGYYTFK